MSFLKSTHGFFGSSSVAARAVVALVVLLTAGLTVVVWAKVGADKNAGPSGASQTIERAGVAPRFPGDQPFQGAPRPHGPTVAAPYQVAPPAVTGQQAPLRQVAPPQTAATAPQAVAPQVMAPRATPAPAAGGWSARPPAAAHPEATETPARALSAASQAPLAGSAIAQGRPRTAIGQYDPAPHVDLGACTACHTVHNRAGSLVPKISALSAPSHPYKSGLCVNCHEIVANATPRPLPDAVSRASVNTATATGGGPSALQAAQPKEGEWLGLEVAPITAATATQYGIVPGTGGVVVAEAEAQAAKAGLKAGDVILSINGVVIANMTAFVQATRSGTLARGLIEVQRGGRRRTVWLPHRPRVAAPSPRPQAPAPSPPGVGATPGGFHEPPNNEGLPGGF